MSNLYIIQLNLTFFASQWFLFIIKPTPYLLIIFNKGRTIDWKREIPFL
jgi:hypothetical protein